MNNRVKVRMYRHGLGDCFLITLPRTGSDDPFYIMIDCGVILGTANPEPLMQKVVQNIAEVTKNGKTGKSKIDLVIGTHEHWDHLSGFVQAEDDIRKIEFDQVWLAWTEDPNDDLAKRIAGERTQAVAALQARAQHMRMAGAAQSADEVEGLLSFFAMSGKTTKDALEVVRSLSKNVSYRSPLTAPFTPEGTSFRLYVLGPPRDEKALKKIDPSKAHPETYGLAMSDVAGSLLLDDADGPFDAMQAIPTETARTLPFFQKRYFEDPDAPWRTVDSIGLDGTTEFALQLDSATNNSCLVLAIELEDGDVLLFPADAQVGNWLSWQDVKWTVDGKTVTGPELVGRCILYKVGHHGSHNATLKEHGLELMQKLDVALIPVNKDMAMKKRWTKMPLPELVDALEHRAAHAVLQADKDLPAGADAFTEKNDLYYEVTL